MQLSPEGGARRSLNVVPKIVTQNSNSNTDSSAYPSTGSQPSQGSAGLLTSAIMLGTMEEGIQSIIAEEELRQFEAEREKSRMSPKAGYERLDDV